MISPVQIIEANFAQHIRRLPSLTPGMAVVDSDHLSYADCGLSCDTFNLLHIRSGADLQYPELQAAIEHYRQKNFAFTIWAEENQLGPNVREIAARAGFSATNREPGMLLDLQAYVPASAPHHANIRPVSALPDIMDSAGIVARNWRPPDSNVITYYARVAPAILAGNSGVFIYLYYHEASPVASIQMLLSEETTAGIYNLSTLGEYRGRGIGTALMTYALNQAQKLGCRYAVLQASEDGPGIYQRLGFEVITYYSELH
jgi:GNAT superfamily N-acetyltransferase